MNKPEQKLQQLYQQSKADHPMPADLKRALLQLSTKPEKRHWHKLWPATQGLVASAALIWLAQQLWWQPEYYQIVLQSDAVYHQVQLHSLATESVKVQQSAYQQRYQQYQQARAQLELSNSLVGQLRFEGQHWQVAVCDQLLLKLDQQLADELRKDNKWQTGQWVELKTGAQGQILSVVSSRQPLHCASS
jgi:hypothetical protein